MPPPVGMAIDIDLVGTRVDLSRDIVEAVVMFQIDRDVPRSRHVPRAPVRGSHRPGNDNEGARGAGVDLVGGPELLHAAFVQDEGRRAN